MSALAPQIKPSFQRADGSPRRVLYAEDQITSRVVTKAILERMGFVVDAVEDGELALQRARNDNYDVILLDIEMPVMDGVTAARSIRAELSHCNDTPILALSAFLADSTEASAWRDAFDSALPKPANSNELFMAMTAAVAFKSARAKPVSAKPTSAELLGALRDGLAPAMWQRVVGLAVEEMHHLVNAIGAGLEAHDAALANHARMKLQQLARSFGAAEVAGVAENGDLAGLRTAVASFGG